MFGTDIGIDLGTANIIVYVRRRGVVVREPSVVAIERESRRILAVGEEARAMIGRTPGNIVAIRPLKDGVIADYDVTQTMLAYFIQRVCGRRPLFKPRVVVCVPSGVTGVEKRAVLEAAGQAGAREVFLVSEPMAAAIGAGLPVGEAAGNLVVDMGGGTIDIAVISLGGEVVSESLRLAGDKLDEAIIRHLKRHHNLIIGERTAEDIKIKIGTAYPDGDHRQMEVCGRDGVTGLPRTIVLTARDTWLAIEEQVRTTIDTIKSVLERTPPELAADIMEKGIVLTGGGALLVGLPQVLREATGIPVHVAEDPLSCVAMGTGRVLESLSVYREKIALATRSS